MSYYRTPEHRALRAKLIRRWKPWEQSTGPKTEQGKSKVATNATKHGHRSKEELDVLRAIKGYLHDCKKNTG